MKHIFWHLILLIMLTACNNNAEQNKQEIKKADSINISKNSRQILIDEIKKIRKIITINNKQQIANIFSFPKNESDFSIYIEDTTFLQKIKNSDNKITNEIFLEYYNAISQNIWLDKMSYLLSNINIDSLEFKNSVELTKNIRNEPCYNNYQIEIDDSIVAFKVNMESNNSYKPNNKSKDEVKENASEYCEHSFWWLFKFNGVKLNFMNIGGAD